MGRNGTTEHGFGDEEPPLILGHKNKKEYQVESRLGTTSYGNPVVADGKVFVGTNNDKPRNPAVIGDKGILMCFREADGKFLWQAVSDKLETGKGK